MDLNRKKKLKRYENYRSLKLSDSYYLALKPLAEILETASKKFAKGNVLDIACGNKPYEHLFDHCSSYTGCDIVQSSKNNVDTICAATNIPFKDYTYDTILCTQVIEHVQDYSLLLSEAFRVLKYGGSLILSGPMYWHLHEEPYDFYRFTKYGFRYIVEQAGFDIIEIIPNGGKWALFGQMVIHTFPWRFVRRSWFRKINNWFFQKLDDKYFDDINTMNYVVIAIKKQKK